MGIANQDAVRLVKPYVDAEVSGAKTKAAGDLAKLFKGQFATAPTAADFVGQLYVNTAAETAGLYLSTGTTTPGWTKIVIG